MKEIENGHFLLLKLNIYQRFHVQTMKMKTAGSDVMGFFEEIELIQGATKNDE